jgi:hypothetical protein
LGLAVVHRISCDERPILCDRAAVLMSAMSRLYIEVQLADALAEVCGGLLDEPYVAPRLIEALEERDIELRPR